MDPITSMLAAAWSHLSGEEARRREAEDAARHNFYAWNTLPPDIILVIIDHLHAYIRRESGGLTSIHWNMDIVRLSQTCKEWHAAIPERRVDVDGMLCPFESCRYEYVRDPRTHITRMKVRTVVDGKNRLSGWMSTQVHVLRDDDGVTYVNIAPPSAARGNERIVITTRLCVGPDPTDPAVAGIRLWKPNNDQTLYLDLISREVRDTFLRHVCGGSRYDEEQEGTWPRPDEVEEALPSPWEPYEEPPSDGEGWLQALGALFAFLTWPSL